MELMLLLSDNSATDVLLRLAGGPGRSLLANGDGGDVGLASGGDEKDGDGGAGLGAWGDADVDLVDADEAGGGTGVEDGGGRGSKEHSDVGGGGVCGRWDACAEWWI